MGKSFYSGTDAELYTGGTNFATKITATPTAYGLVAAQATAYSATNTAYSAAYVAAINPETRTKSKVAAKNAARAALRTATANLAKIINGTPTVTDAQKIDLGLAVRAIPTPIPVPTTSPDVDLVSVVGRIVRIRLHDSVSESKRGKPVGVASAGVFTFVGANPPAEPSMYKFEGITTRTTVDISFPESVASGATVWISACWYNARGQAGISSAPVSVTVQGGAARAAA